MTEPKTVHAGAKVLRFKREPTRIKIGGAFKFMNLPKKNQEDILKRLAEKDKVMAKGHEGIFPGIKIDGKTVTRKSLKELEIKEKVKEIKKPKAEKPVEKFSKKELENKAEEMGFTKFRSWARKNFKVTGRSISGLISDILSGKKEVE